MTREKVKVTSSRFQTFSIRFRSWIITEWMNAVAISHGMNEAFSTGSQAQYPPHPRVRYDHQPP